MWRPMTDRMHDDHWALGGRHDDRWVRGVLEPILLLLAIVIVGALVGLI